MVCRHGTRASSSSNGSGMSMHPAPDLSGDAHSPNTGAAGANAAPPGEVEALLMPECGDEMLSTAAFTPIMRNMSLYLAMLENAQRSVPAHRTCVESLVFQVWL